MLQKTSQYRHFIHTLNREIKIIRKPAFSRDMNGSAILIDFSKMALSRDLGRVRRRTYTHFEAEIRGFRLIGTPPIFARFIFIKI